jgi:hypothetical protein
MTAGSVISVIFCPSGIVDENQALPEARIIHRTVRKASVVCYNFGLGLLRIFNCAHLESAHYVPRHP